MMTTPIPDTLPVCFCCHTVPADPHHTVGRCGLCAQCHENTVLCERCKSAPREQQPLKWAYLIQTNHYCPSCADLLEVAARAQQRIDFDLSIADRVTAAQLAAGLTPEETRQTLENYIPQTARQAEALRALSSSSGGLFLLLGACGVGKSHLTYGTMRKFLTAQLAATDLKRFSSTASIPNPSAKSYTGESFFRSYRDLAYRGEDASETAAFAEMSRSPCAALHDFGAAKCTDKEAALIGEWLDVRYRHRASNMLTIINSNHSTAALMEHVLTPAGCDRLAEVCHVLVLDGESYRRKDSTDNA